MFAKKLDSRSQDRDIQIPEAKKEVPKPIARIVNFLASLHFERNHLMPEEGLSDADKKTLFKINELLRAANTKTATHTLTEALALAQKIQWDPIHDELILRLKNPFFNFDQPESSSDETSQITPTKTPEIPTVIEDKFFKPRIIRLFENVDTSHFTLTEKRKFKLLYALLSSPWTKKDQNNKKNEFVNHVNTLLRETDTKTAAYQNFLENVNQNIAAPATVSPEQTRLERDLSKEPLGQVPDNLPVAPLEETAPEPMVHDLISIQDLIDLLKNFEQNYVDFFPRKNPELQLEEKKMLLELLKLLRTPTSQSPFFVLSEAQKIIRSTVTRKDFDRVKNTLLTDIQNLFQYLLEKEHNQQASFNELKNKIQTYVKETDPSNFSPIEKRRFVILENIFKAISFKNFEREEKQILYYLTRFQEESTSSFAFKTFLDGLQKNLQPVQEPKVLSEIPVTAFERPHWSRVGQIEDVAPVEPIAHETLERVNTPVPPETLAEPVVREPLRQAVTPLPLESLPNTEIQPESPLAAPHETVITEPTPEEPTAAAPTPADSSEENPMSDDSLQGFLQATENLNFDKPTDPKPTPRQRVNLQNFNLQDPAVLERLSTDEFGRFNEGWDDFDAVEEAKLKTIQETKASQDLGKIKISFETPNGTKGVYFGRVDEDGRYHNHGKLEYIKKQTEEGQKEVLCYVKDRATVTLTKAFIKDRELVVRGTSHYTVDAEFLHGEIGSDASVEYLNEHGDIVVVEGPVDENYLPHGENCVARIDRKNLVFKGSFQNGKPIFGRTYHKKNIEIQHGSRKGQEDVELIPLYTEDHYVDSSFHPTDEHGIALTPKAKNADPDRATGEIVRLRELYPDLSPFEENPELTLYGEFPDLLDSPTEVGTPDTDKMPEISGSPIQISLTEQETPTPSENTFESVEAEIQTNFALTEQDFASDPQKQAEAMLDYYETIKMYVNNSGREHFSTEFLEFLEDIYQKFTPETEAVSDPISSITHTQEFHYGSDRVTTPLSPVLPETDYYPHRDAHIGPRRELHTLLEREFRRVRNELHTTNFTDAETTLIEQTLRLLENDTAADEEQTLVHIGNIFRNFHEPITSTHFSHLQAAVLGMVELFDRKQIDKTPQIKPVEPEPVETISRETSPEVKQLRARINDISQETIAASLHSSEHLTTAERRALSALSAHMRRTTSIGDLLATLADFLADHTDTTNQTEYFNTFRQQVDYLYTQGEKRLQAKIPVREKVDHLPIQIERKIVQPQVLSAFEDKFEPLREYFLNIIVHITGKEQAALIKILDDIRSHLKKGDPNEHLFQQEIFDAQEPNHPVSRNFMSAIRKIDEVFFSSQHAFMIDALERTNQRRPLKDVQVFQKEFRTQLLKVLSETEYAQIPPHIMQALFEDPHLTLEAAVQNERVQVAQDLEAQNISIRDIHAAMAEKPPGIFEKITSLLGENRERTKNRQVRSNATVQTWMALEKLLQNVSTIKKP